MEKRTLRRIRMLREKRKNTTMKLLSAVVILSILTICLPQAFNTYADSIDIKTASDDIAINKVAEKTGKPDEFKITLSVKHKPVVIPDKEADIVIVIDDSTTMWDKINKVKIGAKDFCKNILEKSKGNVRISVVTFAGASDQQPNLQNSTKIIRDFTSDSADLAKGIDSIDGSGSTYTKGGIELAGQMLGKSREGAKKYVVLFTDGLPNVLNDDDVKIADKLWRENPEYRNFHLSEISAINQYNQLMKKYSDLKFYTIGLFTQEANRGAQKFLSKIQNAVPENEYASKYYTQNTNEIEDVFKEVSGDIKGQISNSSMKNTIITDVVSDEFEIIPNSYEASGNVKQEALKKTVIDNQTITFNLGEILSDGAVSFLVKSKDPYFGGKGIFTNKSAHITCIDANTGEKVNKEFNKPQVDIDYKKGSLTVEKDVIDSNGNKIESSDKFDISIDGIETNDAKYNLELQGNSSKTMNFYLKDKNTDISNNPDTSLNYLTIGNFTVKETIPMNYKLQKIQIWDYRNNTWVDFNGKFTLNKDNKDVKIKVINKLVNDKYWFDKAECKNKFNFN